MRHSESGILNCTHCADRRTIVECEQSCEVSRLAHQHFGGLIAALGHRHFSRVEIRSHGRRKLRLYRDAHFPRRMESCLPARLGVPVSFRALEKGYSTMAKLLQVS